MTLSSLLNHEPSINPVINDRGEHIQFSPPWKGGSKGNTQSALSALTLLAFLFFLNILQNCLRDQLQNQAPLTIMMTTTTTTTTTDGRDVPRRHKREMHEEKIKGDTAKIKVDEGKRYVEEDYKIFVTEDSNDRPIVSENSQDKLTSWIYDQVCCDNCGLNFKIDETFQNYVRKSVNLFCGLFEHKNCSDDQQYCNDLNHQ